MFYIAVSLLEIAVAPLATLKEKRNMLRSIKQRLRNSFNVSVAEVDQSVTYGNRVLAVVSVANDARYLEGQSQKIVAFVERYFPGMVEDSQFEIDQY